MLESVGQPTSFRAAQNLYKWLKPMRGISSRIGGAAGEKVEKVSTMLSGTTPAAASFERSP